MKQIFACVAVLLLMSMAGGVQIDPNEDELLRDKDGAYVELFDGQIFPNPVTIINGTAQIGGEYVAGLKIGVSSGVYVDV